MTYREQLEKECSVLYGSETDIKKRFEILKDAYWKAHNAGYCDARVERIIRTPF